MEGSVQSASVLRFTAAVLEMQANVRSQLWFSVLSAHTYSSSTPQDIHSQGEVISCLEKGLVSEAEEQPGHYTIREDCKKAIMRVAELSSDDFHLDRHLYFSCREDRERFCENVSHNPAMLTQAMWISAC